MIIYRANTKGNKENPKYPHEEKIKNLSHFKRVLQYDNTPLKMKNNHRSSSNFLECDCAIWDIDNTHSEDPDAWLTKGDIEEAFPFKFYLVKSRNYMKEKRTEHKDEKGKKYTVIHAPREKWHVYAPLKNPIKNKEEYENLIKNVMCIFPFLDPVAIDSARFFYAIENPIIETVENDVFVDEYFASFNPEELEDIQKKTIEDFENKVKNGTYEGRDVNSVIKKAHEFLGLSAPDSKEESKEKQIDFEWIGKAEQKRSLQWLEGWSEKVGVVLGKRYTILSDLHGHKGAIGICVTCPWEHEHSADTGEKQTVILIDLGGRLNFICRHSHGGALSWKDYKAKCEEDARARGVVLDNVDRTVEPLDYTDVGQANVFVSEYGDTVKYNKATSFLVYDGILWNESETRAQLLSQTLTERQLKEARMRVKGAEEKLSAAEASGNPEKVKAAQEQLNKEKSFRKYVLSRRTSSKIKATLTESMPRVEIDVEELDKDGFLLNTPDGTIDLRTGDMKPHVSTDYCTKLTTVSPGDGNAEIFRSFLERVTVGDKDLERYLQEVAGMCAIGKVLRENLIIAYGEGGNGKSTLFNLLAHVLGDYSGMLSAETLTANCRKNKSPEYAELRGKRLIIAAELEEGMRLDTAIVKKLCSTDPILAEKKYKDPFSFIPSHTVILYTNHLPKIGTSDKGTWDRIVAVPFLANFRGMKGEIKNYAEYLYEKCGGAVLTWIVEGAQRFISNEYNIAFPECVKRSIEQYRASNDWLQNFLDECCEIDDKYQAKSGELYERYRRYCDSTGEYKRAQRDFKQALMAAGFEDKKTMRGNIIFGLRVMWECVDGEVNTPWGRASPGL